MDLQKTATDLATGAGWLGFLALLVQRWWQSRDTALQVTAEAEAKLRADLMRMIADRDARIDALQREIDRLRAGHARLLAHYAEVRAICIRAGLSDTGTDEDEDDVAAG